MDSVLSLTLELGVLMLVLPLTELVSMEPPTVLLLTLVIGLDTVLLLLLTMVLEPGALMLMLLMPVPTLVLGTLTMLELTVLPPITLPSVTTDMATLVLMAITHLPFLSEITDMALTVLGEPPPTLVPGPVIGPEPTVLPLMLEKVSGTPLLMLGLVLSTLPPPMVLMTGPPLALLLSTLPPFPDGLEIIPTTC